MALIESWFKQDLNKAVSVQYLCGNVFSQDNLANKVGVSVYSDGEAATLSGSISANVIRSDGTTVSVAGSFSGNQAWVILPQAAYAIPGLISIIIKCTSSTTITTLCAVVATVYNSITDPVIDPGTIIPSVQNLIAQIEAAVATIPADYSSLWTSLAPAFSTSTAYKAGEYVTYNGKLYRFIKDHAVGSWVSGDVTAVNLGEETWKLNNETRIYNSLTNEGTYTIVSSDLESGYWAYTTKVPNSKRLRNIYLIPVKSGMVVTYTNPTMKIYIGVFNNLNSSSYLQNTGWINAGKTNADYSIKYDGYMDVMLESTNAITTADYDSTISITTKANVVSFDQSSEWIDGKTVLPFTQNIIDSSTGNLSYSSTRASTNGIVPKKGTYIVKGNGLFPMIWKNGNLSGGTYERIVFTANGNEEIKISVKKPDGSSLYTDYATKNCIMERYGFVDLESEKATELNGVSVKKLTENDCLSISTDFFRYGYATDVFKMPKSGVHICRNAVNGTPTAISFMFFRMSGGVLVPATDYEYSNIKWSDDVPTFLNTSLNIYFPYDDNLYFCIRTPNGIIPDDIYISSGTVQNGNGRLTNLSPASVKYVGTATEEEPITGYHPSFSQFAGYGYATQQYYYGTIIRLQDAKAICCTAELSMSCWWYDNNGTLLGREYGNARENYAISGKTYIDLSKYGTEGYCVVVIRSPNKVIPPEADATLTNFDEPTMGGFRLYNYVLNNVYVQYYNRTIIAHDFGLNPKIAHNIELLKNLDCGDTFAFGYRGPVTRTKMTMRAMKHVSPCFYASPMYSNTLFQNVSLKSYVTALQNFNSQIYLVEIGGNSARYSSFGMVCNSLPPILSGYEWSSRLFVPGADPAENDDFEYIDNWDYTKDPERLKPGDWLIGKEMDDSEGENGHDTHVVFITDVIRINGEIICYEAMEAYPPYLKYRYIYISSPLDKFNKEYSRNEPLGSFFRKIARPKDPSTFKTLEEAFGNMNTNYTVGTLMCDRGTDSVYGIGEPNCYITVNDEEMESFTVYKDGNSVTTVDLSTATLVEFGTHPLKAVDIAGVIRTNGAGYYTLKPNNKDTAQESFAVGGLKDISFDFDQIEGHETIQITLGNPEDLAYVVCVYNQENYDPIERNKKTFVSYTPDMIESGVLTIPTQCNYWADHIYTFNYCIGIYKVKRTVGNDTVTLGTYCVLRDEEGHGTYVFSGSAWGTIFPDS